MPKISNEVMLIQYRIGGESISIVREELVRFGMSVNVQQHIPDKAPKGAVLHVLHHAEESNDVVLELQQKGVPSEKIFTLVLTDIFQQNRAMSFAIAEKISQCIQAEMKRETEKVDQKKIK